MNNPRTRFLAGLLAAVGVGLSTGDPGPDHETRRPAPGVKERRKKRKAQRKARKRNRK